MFARIVLFVAVMLATGSVAREAKAESRVALVIGNSAYKAISPLSNPANDARAMTEILQSAGFEVIVATDLSQADMRRAVRDFAAKISEKGADTVAVVYYAGHGVQIEGENFLVPVDARVERQSDVAIETLRLADVMSTLEDAPSRARIVMLDACRNNPFSTLKGSSGRGLAIVDAPSGSLVAYSTSPGSEADDGGGDNSPYTRAFLEAAREPDVPIEQVFKRVRVRVNKVTDGRQVPWESSSLTDDFALFRTGKGAPGAGSQQPGQQQGSAGAQGAGRGQGGGGSQGEQGNARVQIASDNSSGKSRQAKPVSAWTEEIRARGPREAYDLVVEEDSVEIYEEFVRLYPSDPLAARIRDLMNRRREAVAWRNAALINTPQSYQSYISLFPRGAYAAEAQRLRERPRLRPIDPILVRRSSPIQNIVPRQLALPNTIRDQSDRRPNRAQQQQQQQQQQQGRDNRPALQPQLAPNELARRQALERREALLKQQKEKREQATKQRLDRLQSLQKSRLDRQQAMQKSRLDRQDQVKRKRLEQIERVRKQQIERRNVVDQRRRMQMERVQQRVQRPSSVRPQNVQRAPTIRQAPQGPQPRRAGPPPRRCSGPNCR